MSGKAQLFDDARRLDHEFLYSVLNLPSFASEADIKERHRALSLVFHPDKQRDETVKDIAKERFLEIQAAYEILSDPFLREVYDTLGYNSLKLNFPPHFRNLPRDEIRPALRAFLYDHESEELSSQITSRATVACLLDVRELVSGGPLDVRWYADLAERVSTARLSILSLRHSFIKRIAPQTKLQVVSKIGQLDLDEFDQVQDMRRFNLLRGNVTGTITHQMSASKQLQIKASLLRLYRGFTVAVSHEDKLNFARVSLPIRPLLNIPPLSVTLRRRLFRDSFTIGTFDATLTRGVVPTISIGLLHPSVSRSSVSSKRGSSFSGERRRPGWLATGWAAGLNLRLPAGPSLYVQYQALCQALHTSGKVGFEYGPLMGLGGTIEGEWTSEEGDADVGTSVSWDGRGVVFRLSCTYLGQKLELPVTLAEYYSLRIMLGAVILPALIFLGADYAVLRRKREERRRKRVEAFGRERVERGINGKAEAEGISTMLTDVARRSLTVEKAQDGLIIAEATYFPVDVSASSLFSSSSSELAIPELGLDVRVPLQALVQKSQLYLPGGRSKSVLRGVYDPLPDPECEKRLAVRYTFRGREHYVEVDEFGPLLIPLESHLANGTIEKPMISVEKVISNDFGKPLA